MSFETLPKEQPGRIPLAVGDRIRLLAARDRRSIAEVTTELLCVALEIDPREFEIEPRIARPKRRRPVPA